MKADDLQSQARCGEALIIKIFTIMTEENKDLGQAYYKGVIIGFGVGVIFTLVLIGVCSVIGI